MKHTHADHLERWLGAEHVRQLSEATRLWYGPPIPVFGVPGVVFAAPGGDFIGEIRGGGEACAVQRARDYLQRERRRSVSLHAHRRRQAGAFGTLDALIAARTGGKGQSSTLNKVGTTAPAVGNVMSLFRVGPQPAAGAAASAAPGGVAPTSATTGAMAFANPANANTSRFVAAWMLATVAPNSLLLYDRIFAVVKTMNSTATEAVTGVPTRYQNTTANNDDYAGGNFVFPEVGTVLPATAHNWTVCQYTNQAGTAAKSIPSIAGQGGGTSTANCVDLAVNNWFMPLATGDVGVKALTQMQSSALVATGTIDFVMGHPIGYMACPIASLMCVVDNLYTAFNLARVYDSACLSLLELPKPAVTATTYAGQVDFVAE